MATYSAWVKNNSGTITWDSMRLSEQHIYGSARVGMALTNVKLHPQVPKNPHLPDTSRYPIFEGWKRYEISNHLGNVLAVITDRKHGKAASGTAIQWFEADLVAAQQYYPFGMLMPGDGPGVSASWKRQYTLNGNDYRYGFNGKEGDDELKGDDNQQDYGMRIYDPRVGRFLSVDPIAREYPWYTPYQFAGNMPIWAVDLDGLEPKIPDMRKIGRTYIRNVLRTFSGRLRTNEKELDYVTNKPMKTIDLSIRILPWASMFAQSLNLGPGIENAVRHSYGQAIAAAAYGMEEAVLLANTHENNNSDILERTMAVDERGNTLNIRAESQAYETGSTFVRTGDADSFVDQLNNFQGRSVAAETEKKTGSRLKLGVLNALSNGLLFEAVEAGQAPQGYLLVRRITEFNRQALQRRIDGLRARIKSEDASEERRKALNEVTR
jgi:RHS repeat-associated protein